MTTIDAAAPQSPQKVDVRLADDAVHVDQAAKALGVSRRTVERMIERGELERDVRHDSRTAAVTKRSLVEALEAQRGAGMPRQPRQLSYTSRELAGALEAIERLTDALTDERRQLMAAAEDRRTAEREREEARIEAARLQAELGAHRQAADERARGAATERETLRAQLEEIANASPVHALKLRRRLRTTPR